MKKRRSWRFFLFISLVFLLTSTSLAHMTQVKARLRLFLVLFSRTSRRTLKITPPLILESYQNCLPFRSFCSYVTSRQATPSLFNVRYARPLVISCEPTNNSPFFLRICLKTRNFDFYFSKFVWVSFWEVLNTDKSFLFQ